ncbi:MAG: hypothetical protein GXX83_07585 [Gaiellales bacterium]|nr:hypothetical protein [Gaiellales bacterium]
MNLSQTAWIIIGAAAVIVVALAVYISVRVRRRRRVRAMKPEERELYEAQRQYDADVSRAEQTLRTTRETWDKREKQAEEALVDTQTIGYRPLGNYKKLKLFEDHLEAPEGSFVFGTGTLTVTVETAQRLAAARPEAISRAEKEVFRDLMARAGEPEAAKTEYLLIETPIFVSLTPAEDGARVRQFASTLATAAEGRDAILAKREEAAAAAQTELGATRREKEAAVKAAERQLEAIRGNRARLDAARQTCERANPSSPSAAASPTQPAGTGRRPNGPGEDQGGAA